MGSSYVYTAFLSMNSKHLMLNCTLVLLALKKNIYLNFWSNKLLGDVNFISYIISVAQIQTKWMVCNFCKARVCNSEGGKTSLSFYKGNKGRLRINAGKKIVRRSAEMSRGRLSQVVYFYSLRRYPAKVSNRLL